MTDNVFEAVKNAREFFCIQDFPGNLFILTGKREQTYERIGDTKDIFWI